MIKMRQKRLVWHDMENDWVEYDNDVMEYESIDEFMRVEVPEETNPYSRENIIDGVIYLTEWELMK